MNKKTVIVIVVLLLVVVPVIVTFSSCAESMYGERINTPEMKELRAKLTQLPSVKSADTRLRFARIEIEIYMNEPVTETNVESIMEIVKTHFDGSNSGIMEGGVGINVVFSQVHSDSVDASFFTRSPENPNDNYEWVRWW